MNKKAVRLQLLTALEKKIRHEVRVSGRGVSHNHVVKHPRADKDIFFWDSASTSIYTWVLMRNQRRRGRKSLTSLHYFWPKLDANPLSAHRKH